MGCISSFVLYKTNSYEAVGTVKEPVVARLGVMEAPYTVSISLVTHSGALEIKWSLGSSTKSLGGSI